jgi:hypothetical protein
MANKFKRGLPAGALECLATMDWWRDVLAYTTEERAPGDQLLIAVRDGYFNIYAQGQSVLKVGFDVRRKGDVRLRCRIHRKYVSENDTGSDYLYFDGHEVTGRQQRIQVYTGPKTLQGWVQAARKYAGPEKTGVAIIVENHSSVVDVEMALPADEPSIPDSKKVANRMDIVALEPSEGGARLVFYEAKLLSNPELRARDNVPKVLGQMNNYYRYVSQTERRQEILDAYKNACSVLMAIDDMRGRVTNPLIKMVAKHGLSELDPKPRLVLFGQVDGKAMNEAAWEQHARILQGNGIVIQHQRAEDIVLGIDAR